MQTRHTVSVDGDDVAAVHHEAGGDRWLFFSHGLLSDKSGSYEGRCERAVEEGYDAVRFDHRGCSESDLSFEETTLSTRIDDLRGVVEHFDPGRYALYGSSFGGKVVLHLAAEAVEGPEAVATRAPVTYVEALDPLRHAVEDEAGDAAGPTGGVGAPALAPGFFDDLHARRFAEVERGLDVPVAVFHGRDDSVVPASYSVDAVEALAVDASLHLYAGEGHRFSRAAEARLRDQLFDWLPTVTTRG